MTRAAPLRIVAFALAIGCAPVDSLHAQGSPTGDQVGVFVGGWLGADFLQRSVQVADPALGTIEYSSALNQGNGLLIGVNYTAHLSRFMAADIAVGYVSGTWTTEAGRVQLGVPTRETTVISGVTTIPMALNLLIKAPTPSVIPQPFVTAGLGGVFYEFSESNAPLRIPLVVGTPLDTVLFDLKLGFRVAPNIGGGVMYSVTDRIGIRAEGRMWATLILERVTDERFVQRNKWFLLSAMFRL